MTSAGTPRAGAFTRAQYLDEVTWTTKSWLGLQKQRISVVLHTAIAEQIVNVSLPTARAVECTELSASPSSPESLRRLQWCTCVSASARQSRAQSCAQCLSLIHI